ncbi:NAD(P)H-flavin reductase [Idiomarina seosinensis]|uniref:NAD(P)H-flavin reductase n=1 Tax=Idiomarina seosinensis TaxID=281739 RepID=UPI00384EC13F
MSQQLTCQANITRQLAEFVWEVCIKLPKAVEFKAGQYLQVVMGERDKRPFSIASGPADQRQWLLHVGAPPDNDYAGEVLEKIKQQGELIIEAPAGDAFLQLPQKDPIILIAGGTGFSYTYSILQKLLQDGLSQPVYLYWGARQKADLYLHEKLEQLAAEHSEFFYRPVLEETDGQWPYSVGLVHHAVMSECNDLQNHQVYMAGRFEMIRVIRDDFVAHGLSLQQLHADALAFI